MEAIFALDIGTRMVMGLLMTREEQTYKILASACTEHTQRAMYDGQVHDVDEVAIAVKRVKEELEEKCGEKLRRVSVAAAGRALVTQISSAERYEILPIRWEKEDVLALEMEAIQQALRQIDAVQNDDGMSYHCVGYSLIESFLDDQPIANLIGQRGKKARVKVIATFLPRAVIDGLVSVLGRANLDMQSLTLEPIAAGQAAIPPNMRRMNLALVDVGAGTSDIALTKNGTFFSYGMVPMAGDEVTEVLAEKYLLDFQVAEKIKREIGKKKKITYTDFFGNKHSLPKEEVLDTIRSVVRELADRIAATICELNQGPPQAIILIGGGSQTPMLREFLAEAMNLPLERVGLQVRERLPNVFGEEHIKGPQGITPIGIGMAALEDKGLHYYSVWVNDIPVPIFELQLATVAEALLAAGIHPRSFLGRPGPALTFELNGEIQVIKGSMGKPAQLLVNGQSAKLEQMLRPGDKVLFTPGVPGEEGKAKIKDIVPPMEDKTVIWNGEPVPYCAKVYLNGQEAGRDEDITDGSKITFIRNDDLEQFLRQKGVSLTPEQEINIKIQGKPLALQQKQFITVNGRIVKENIPLNNGDRIEYSVEEIKIKDLGLSPEPMYFYVNGKYLVYPPQTCQILWRGEEVNPEDPVVDGMELKVVGFKEAPTLAHILPYAGVDKEAPIGSKLLLEVNGQPAEFTTVLKSGDRITVEWVSL